MTTRAVLVTTRGGFSLWGMKTEPLERRLTRPARVELARLLQAELEEKGCNHFEAPEMPEGQNLNCQLFGCVRVCDSFDASRSELRGVAHVWAKDLENR